jgi:endonuclease III-like uncharacterized protein
MDRIYAPGCALTIYKPHLAERMHGLLNRNLGEMERLDTCCRNHPILRDGVQVINTCPGCDRRYRNNYTNSKTKSVWEIIAEGDWFPLLDYHNAKMSIHDACPTRDQVRVHKAIRTLLRRMNIEVVEPERTGTTATCCGDSLYPSLPVEEVNEAMRRRAAYNRLEEATGEITPTSFLKLDDAELKAVGFSRQKTRYGRLLAEGILGGSFDLGALEDLPDDEARTRLMELKGIGRWSADIYLLMALRRPDVWPHSDLALISAVTRIKGLDKSPTHYEWDEIGEAWRPWRSVAARLAWFEYLGGKP